MMRKIALFILFLGVLCSFGFQAEAKQRKGTKLAAETQQATKGINDMVPCPLFVNSDGTQVLATFRRSNKKSCAWADTTLEHVADFQENILCSYKGGGCEKFDKLTPLGKDEFLAMKEVWERDRGDKRGCEPRTDNRTFKTDMAPAANGYGCGAKIAAIRHYNFLLGVVFILDGNGKTVGQYPITPEHASDVIARN